MERVSKKNIIKFIFNCIIFILLAFNSSVFDYASASDYKYKVLDPKYNPEAQQLIDGTLPPERTMYVEKKDDFDVWTFLAIFALITFPFAIVYIAVKTFKDVMSDYNEDEQVIGNIKIEKQEQETEQKQDLENIQKVNLQETNPVVKKKINTKEIPDTFVKKYFSDPIDSEKPKNPILLYTSPLSSNKGFCLVEYNTKYSLIGYINDDIFLLNQFERVKTKEIRARLSETKKSGERYIIKMDEYKALVEVSDKKMNLLIEL